MLIGAEKNVIQAEKNCNLNNKDSDFKVIYSSKDWISPNKVSAKLGTLDVL